MASASITSVPQPSKDPKQRSISYSDAYLYRNVTPWARPSSLSAGIWRSWVANQPIAMICRETLIANFLALDWKITPRDSDMRDELKSTIKHYTRLLEHGGFNPINFGLDYSGFMEWILSDLLDLPFGTASEVGRRGDESGGRVLWLKPLDGGTLYPTLNKDFPLIQYYNGNLVSFPEHSVVRAYISPRPEITREGWGMAPPEKIFLALEMLMRGDRYYANLLLDVPPAGILDLGDMAKDSAVEWVSAFKSFMVGSSMDAFKIPVLYEHTTKTEFIPLGKIPNDIMYDKIILKYAGIVASGYGMSLSDIGLPSSGGSGGDTLAGTIRQERRAKKTGFARIKKKIKYFVESFLPSTLQFDVIDLDDELNVALGRARLANSTAWGQYLDKGVFSREEARLQTIQDGLITISVPEKIPPEAEKEFQKINSPERPGALGSPVAPSSGGHGEVKLSSFKVEKSKNFDSHVRRIINDIAKEFIPKLREASEGFTDDELFQLQSYVEDSLFGEEDFFDIGNTIKSAWANTNWLRLSFDGLPKELRTLSDAYIRKELESYRSTQYENGEIDSPDVSEEEWSSISDKIHRVNFKSVSTELSEKIRSSLKVFIGKSIIYLIQNSLSSEDVIDIAEQTGYDSIVGQVYTHMAAKFDEFVGACVDIETRNILDKIKLEVLK